MTPVETVSVSLHFAMALAFLWILLFYFWRRQRVDVLRERLFEIRAKLFDYAANGAVSFDDPAYTGLRVLMNGMIRFAHRFSGTRIIMTLVFRRELGDFTPAPLARWEKAMERLPEENRKVLRGFHDDMMIRIVLHVTTGSPVLMLVFLVYALRYWVSSGNLRSRVWVPLKQQVEEVTKRLPHIETVEVQAIAAEMEEEPAGATA
jgi:hypothetical protein